MEAKDRGGWSNKSEGAWAPKCPSAPTSVPDRVCPARSWKPLLFWPLLQPRNLCAQVAPSRETSINLGCLSFDSFSCIYRYSHEHSPVRTGMCVEIRTERSEGLPRTQSHRRKQHFVFLQLNVLYVSSSLFPAGGNLPQPVGNLSHFRLIAAN